MRSIPREVRFEVHRGRLVRHVRRADGLAYPHRCTLEARMIAYHAQQVAG